MKQEKRQLKRFITLTKVALCFSLSFVYASYVGGDEKISDSSNSENKTREVIEEIICWGVGLSGVANLALCSTTPNALPAPASYYVYTASAIAYFAIDKLVDDEDKKTTEKITSKDYGGTNDAQMNSYKKSRDIALANHKSAEKKGDYKLAASVGVLAAAVLSYNEALIYDAGVKDVEQQTTKLCTPPSPASAATASGFFKTNRCGNLSGAKVICTKNDQDKLRNAQSKCIEGATVVLSACPVSVVPQSSLVTMAETPVGDSVTGAGLDGIDKSGLLYDNFVTNIITGGGHQYLPRSRALLYGAIGFVLGANAITNNVAALKYEEDAKYFQKLVDGMEESVCVGECSNSASSDLVVTEFHAGEMALNFEQTITDNQWGVIIMKWTGGDGKVYQKGMDQLPNASTHNGTKWHVMRDLVWVHEDDQGELPTKGWTTARCKENKIHAFPNSGTTIYYAVSGQEDGKITSFAPFTFTYDVVSKFKHCKIISNGK